jgi:hypothetical protein
MVRSRGHSRITNAVIIENSRTARGADEQSASAFDAGADRTVIKG